MAYYDYHNNKITWSRFVWDNKYVHLLAICLFFIGFIIYHIHDIDSREELILSLSIPSAALLAVILGGMIGHWKNYTKYLYKR